MLTEIRAKGKCNHQHVFDQVALRKIKAILKHSVYNKMDIAYLRRIGAEVIIY